ncbi:hypothetical protein [Flectobacillus rivi]|uniref:Uncharacterized protein n=1 Tax=Flectobacillus rivi TaxID=2984209 RepID=A0ABT6YZK6_9BACT|nr:hypothetical protein [Flectobacillus rivi]MDI9873849.1 hypothetical protein [Flectobacillus rivi]
MIKTPLIRYSLAIICIWVLNLQDTIASNFRSRQACQTSFSTDTVATSSTNPLLDLAEGESFSVLVNTSNCFTNFNRLVLITKENGTLVSRYYMNPSMSPQPFMARAPSTINNGELISTHIMNEANIDFFKNFLLSLSRAKDVGCSTTETYYLKSRAYNLQKLDGSCQWSGFGLLIKELFNQ